MRSHDHAVGMTTTPADIAVRDKVAVSIEYLRDCAGTTYSKQDFPGYRSLRGAAIRGRRNCGCSRVAPSYGKCHKAQRDGESAPHLT